MNRLLFNVYTIVIITFCINIAANSQSIRKNHIEMTASEKNNLVAAFYQLVNTPDLLVDLAVYHNDNFNEIHFNLPQNPAIDVFLPFHRALLWELELAMQRLNPNLSVPFVDWTIDNTTTSSIWDFNFMGQFNTAFTLNRTVGLSGFTLPQQSDINNIQSTTNFYNYSNNMERGIVHTGGHSFVGGQMNGGFAPIDPIFHLHHCMVDKLWNDWETINLASTFIKTTIPRYDGTYFYNGQTYPAINPNAITKASDIGIFYAENQYVMMQNYSITNNNAAQENFYYQYFIDCGNGFRIPTNRRAQIESIHSVTFVPGFEADYGSVFTAKIDEDNNIGTPTLQAINTNVDGEVDNEINNDLIEQTLDINKAKQNVFSNYRE